MRISLFITCYNDTLFPRTGQAVVTVLERLGHTVEFREAQTCCGQMHYNSGYHAQAFPLMEKFVADFRDSGAICIPSSSCVSMIREHYPVMAEKNGNPELVREVNELLPRVFEFSELLVDKLGVEDTGSYFPHRVAYHPSCHSLRSLHVGDKPVRLLKSVRGLTFVPIQDAEQCCGFGGTFSVKNAEVSSAMVEEKARCVIGADADYCAAIDNSCLMQIGGALSRMSTRTRTVHLAEILAATEGDADGGASGSVHG
ncbi:MAG TPA: (Fe-S)-binding protein [Bryobacteraceae bacterium]|nr:(Fe-S)-binding protein [Bryobacteraceae bacterium]